MLFVLLGLGCAKKVAWKISPVPTVEVDTALVSVAAQGAECRELADEVLAVLGTRPGVRIEPDAPTRLVVRDCEQFLATIVEVQEAMGDDITDTSRRRLTVEGTGSATIEVWSGEVVIASLTPQEFHIESSSWADEGRIPAPRARAVTQALNKGVAVAVADDLAPLPESLERKLYANAEPGTARALHNSAVEAEQSGDLDKAMRLAREAYAADPSQRSMRYLEQLEVHAQRVGYAWNAEQ